MIRIVDAYDSDRAERASYQLNPGARIFMHNFPDASAGAGESTSARFYLASENLSFTNVSQATSLTLYRERAEDIRAVYERMWRCYVDNRATEYVFGLHESDGDDASRVRHLRANAFF